MLPRSAAHLHRTAVSTAAAFLIFSVLIAESTDKSPVKCSTTCAAENCDTIGIRYGKYCGVGWTGCAGEKPCDDVDACCQIHDDCVGMNGVINIQCHEEFKKCLKKVHISGKEGFSKACPYDTTIPTMIQGMDIAILLSQMGAPREDL
ncbi:probable phospholipase A2 homolog 1 [Salvia hispanica]|uniref:probable phospholipase A2 homolog 1 n=1 Tax=Salvia hispanica TaxID=49212 RepID=UPI002009CDC6|nr:probable phospholipase A2 homolog 1 [Salvia hispanica]